MILSLHANLGKHDLVKAGVYVAFASGRCQKCWHGHILAGLKKKTVCQGLKALWMLEQWLCYDFPLGLSLIIRTDEGTVITLNVFVHEILFFFHKS